MSARATLVEGGSSATYIHLMQALERRLSQILRTENRPLKCLAGEAGEAASYHLLTGGNRVRAQLALHAGRALGLSASDAVTLAATCELLHNASLIHDDLQDLDPVRRGARAVWVAYGESVAICTGDLLLSAAYGALATFSQPQTLPALLALVHARTACAIEGQCADLSAQRGAVNTVAAYERIARAKSGALLSLPLELVLVAAGQGRWCAEARRAAEAFAIGYQIADDLEDLEKDEDSGDSQPCLNIVLVLSAPGCREEARKAARSLGLRHLSTTAVAASHLPDGSGDLLREFAQRLSAKL